MDLILLIPFLFGFFAVLFSTKIWIKKAEKIGLTGKDIHKKNKEKIAEAGGLPVLFGFIFSVFIYIYLRTFYFKSPGNLNEIFAILSSLSIIGFIGFMDDIFGWKVGLTKNIRITFLVFAAIPLVVLNSGVSNMMGIEFGILYPLVLIPLGIVGASATFNFIAGYNGLETSQGIIILSALSFVNYYLGNKTLALIILIMVSCLIAFYIFNKYPAIIFPGDTLTYSVGALIAISAIVGNTEKIAIIFFIPYIIETILKLRGKLEKESFGKLNSDGSLSQPYDKIYGLEHLAINILKKIKKSKKVYEYEVVYFINFIQIIFIAIGLTFLGL